jgi:small redox-active disulfide protein 2
MKIKILGSGCAKCKALEQRVRQLDERLNLQLDIEKVTDIKEMMQFGLLMTPGLVVDGVLRSSGTIPTDDQLAEWLKGEPS